MNSILAGEASGRFSLRLGELGTFDCRISQLPSVSLVVDYFRWRNEDAARNALGAYCYWTLRKEGHSQADATARLCNLSTADKNELLFGYGINFNDVPSWQKRGTGLYWEDYDKTATNPKTGEQVQATRRRLTTNFELPMKTDYEAFVAGLVGQP